MLPEIPRSARGTEAEVGGRYGLPIVGPALAGAGRQMHCQPLAGFFHKICLANDRCWRAKAESAKR